MKKAIKKLVCITGMVEDVVEVQHNPCAILGSSPDVLLHTFLPVKHLLPLYPHRNPISTQWWVSCHHGRNPAYTSKPKLWGSNFPPKMAQGVVECSPLSRCYYPSDHILSVRRDMNRWPPESWGFCFSCVCFCRRVFCFSFVCFCFSVFLQSFFFFFYLVVPHSQSFSF